MTVAWKQNLSGLRKCSRRRQVCALHHTVQSEERAGYRKSTGDGLGRQKKAERGQLWGCIKSKMINSYFFYIGGYRIINSQQ